MLRPLAGEPYAGGSKGGAAKPQHTPCQGGGLNLPPRRKKVDHLIFYFR